MFRLRYKTETRLEISFFLHQLLRSRINPVQDLIRGHFKYTLKMNEWFTNLKKSPPPPLYRRVGGVAVYNTNDSGSGFTKEKQILNRDREKVSI